MRSGVDGSPNRTARLSGALYLGLAPFSVFGLIYVPARLIVPGDAAATATNILASEGLFRAGILSHLIAQVIFVVLVLTLFKLFRPVSAQFARAMAVLALIGVPIAVLSEIHSLAALQVLDSTDYLTAFGPDRAHSQAMLFLDLRSDGIALAQVFWGLWLLPLGYVVLASGFLPRFLGVLVIIGGLGYLVDALVFLRFPASGMSVSQFTFVGELAFPVWLLFRGVNREPEAIPPGKERS